MECKDSLSLSVNLPPSITEENTTDGSLIFHGSGDKHLVKKLLNEITYINNNEISFARQRRVTFTATNLRKNLRVTRDVAISINKTQPSISVFGECEHTYNKSQDVKLCDRLQISMNGCSLLLDSMLVQIDQFSQENRERLYVAESLIKKYGLKQRQIRNGFVVHGLTSVENYSDVMQNIRYHSTAVPMTDEKCYRKISVWIVFFFYYEALSKLYLPLV